MHDETAFSYYRTQSLGTKGTLKLGVNHNEKFGKYCTVEYAPLLQYHVSQWVACVVPFHVTYIIMEINLLKFVPIIYQVGNENVLVFL